MKLNLTHEQSLGIIRHALTAVKTKMVYRGKTDEASWTIITEKKINIVAVLERKKKKKA